jgi:hypothetical protein
MEYSKENLVFLDTLVKKSLNDESLIVELYTKPTDTHNYLLFTSSHPAHTKRGGPYGQFLRIRRNCTLDVDYDKHSQYIKEHYLKRGYPLKIVEKSRLKARAQNRAKLLNPEPSEKQENDNILPLILTHHPSNHQVRKVIMENWGLLAFSDIGKKALPKLPLFGTRRAINLKDTIIRSRLDPYAIPQVSGRILANLWDPCVKRNCKICPKLPELHTATSSVTGKTYQTPSFVQCTTINVIYLLKCTSCNKQYIGESKRTFAVRYGEHLGSIRNFRPERPNLNLPVARHVHNHRDPECTITPRILEVINRDPETVETRTFRRKREAFWIHRFKTLIPLGLNTFDSLLK